MKRFFLMIFSLILSFQLKVGFSDTIYEHTLSNGLNIIIKPIHRAPIATIMIWYKVGSADEEGGKTGLSHALEHMMFKGTSLFKEGEFSHIIASLGGEENAFTNTDYTAYFETVGASNVDTCLKMEADRMHHLTLSSEPFSKEIKVIQEERRMRTDDNPQSLAFERYMATANLIPPYQHPVIGWMSDLQQMNIETLRKWYNTYYTPNNATLVIVGDVNPKDIVNKATQYFNSIPSKPVPKRVPQLPPPALGEKRVNIHANAKLPILLMGYTVPSVKTARDSKDAYALELIATLLSGGESSRLPKNIVRNQHIALNAEAFYDLYTRYDSQFVLAGTPSEKTSFSTLKKAFIVEIDKLKKTPITNNTLNRIKTQLIAQKTFEKDSMFGQAMAIGLLETIDLPYQTEDNYIMRINEITPKDIQTVAKRYFQPFQLTEAHLIPNQQGRKHA